MTCTAVEGKPGRGVELLDEKLRQRDLVVCAQRVVATLPVEHEVFICVGIWEAHTADPNRTSH